MTKNAGIRHAKIRHTFGKNQTWKSALFRPQTVIRVDFVLSVTIEKHFMLKVFHFFKNDKFRAVRARAKKATNFWATNCGTGLTVEILKCNMALGTVAPITVV